MVTMESNGITIQVSEGGVDRMKRLGYKIVAEQPKEVEPVVEQALPEQVEVLPVVEAEPLPEIKEEKPAKKGKVKK